MKYRIVFGFSFVIILATFCVSLAGVTMYGQQGLLRVHSARGWTQGLLTVNLHNEGWYEDDMPVALDPKGIGRAYF